MAIHIDLHVHTSRYSKCSQLDPERLIERAVKSGLDGLVITEHAKQWPDEELHDLVEASGAPGFLLLSGFEYQSSCGHLLIYGLTHQEVEHFERGWVPEEAVARARDLGGVCVAAHPTQAGQSFDNRIVTIPLMGMEIASTRMEPHEKRLAARLAEAAGVPPLAGSDAHALNDIGRHATEFDDPIRSMEDLHESLGRGRFRPVDGTT